MVNVAGFAAGQHHTHYGEATNLACLPLSPEYHDYLAANTGNYIYGAEYETGSNIFGNLQNQNDPMCKMLHSAKNNHHYDSSEKIMPGQQMDKGKV